MLQIKDDKDVSIKYKKKSSTYGRNSQSGHFCQNCWEIKDPPSLQCKQRSSPWQSSLSITSHPTKQPSKQTQQNLAYFAKPCPTWRGGGCQNSFERCLICQTWRSRGDKGGQDDCRALFCPNASNSIQRNWPTTTIHHNHPSTTNNPTNQPFFSLTIWYKLGTTASSICGWRFIPLCCNSILWVRANRSLSLLVQHTKRRLPVKMTFKGRKQWRHERRKIFGKGKYLIGEEERE